MMYQCKGCFHEFTGDICWHCKHPRIQDEKVFEENKEFFGIQEKEEVENVETNWSKLGGKIASKTKDNTLIEKRRKQAEDFLALCRTT